MALTIEDGSGVENADSYVSLVDVEAYFDAYGKDRTAWDAAAAATQEAWVREASQYLEGKYRELYPGRRVYERQSLGWPRFSARDVDGIYWDRDEVPREVKQAQMELVWRRSQGTSLLPDQLGGSSSAIETKDKVGALEVVRKYEGSEANKDPVFGIVDTILSPILGDPSVINLVRA